MEAVMIPGQSMTLNVPAVSQNGTAPRCGHLNGLAPVKPAEFVIFRLSQYSGGGA